MGSNPARAALFSLGEEMFRFVVLPCFDLGLTVPLYNSLKTIINISSNNIIIYTAFVVLGDEKRELYC